MEFARGWQWAAVVVLLCASGVAEVGEDGQVRVLVYDDARAPASVLQQAGSEAIRIFREAGIDLRWVNCSDRSARDECQTVSNRDKLIVNVIAKAKSASESVYGDAFLAKDGNGRYADIFFDRIDQTHREDGINEARLLGAVAAHEIGHLLLGFGAHSWLGIMAPKWSGEHIRQLEMGRLLFAPQQANRMQERIFALTTRSARTRVSEKSYASGKPKVFPADRAAGNQ
jgi:hypothetical protein